MPVDIDQRLPNGIAISSGSNEEAEQAWVKHSRSAIESSTEPPDALDWQAFRAAYFPGRRRHDLAAIIAYAAYRHSLKPASREPTHIRTSEDHLAAVDALRGWEDEAAPDRRPKSPNGTPPTCRDAENRTPVLTVAT